MKNFFMVVLTAIFTAAIVMACGAPVAQQPTTQVESATQVVVEATAQPTQVTAEAQKSQPTKEKYRGYWTLGENKSFKAIEWGCTQRWDATLMPTGCVIIIDRKGKGFSHDGLSAPFGVVVPFDKGVTIKVGWDTVVYVAAKAKTYTFVVIDDKGASVRHEFLSRDALWDDELLREFFIAQMGGQVETIWREGVSDID